MVPGRYPDMEMRSVNGGFGGLSNQELKNDCEEPVGDLVRAHLRFSCSSALTSSTAPIAAARCVLPVSGPPTRKMLLASLRKLQR